MYFKATIPHAGPTAFEILELQKAVTGACVPFSLGHNCNTSSSEHQKCNKISLVNSFTCKPPSWQPSDSENNWNSISCYCMVKISCQNVFDSHIKGTKCEIQRDYRGWIFYFSCSNLSLLELFYMLSQSNFKNYNWIVLYIYQETAHINLEVHRCKLSLPRYFEDWWELSAGKVDVYH